MFWAHSSFLLHLQCTRADLGAGWISCRARWQAPTPPCLAPSEIHEGCQWLFATPALTQAQTYASCGTGQPGGICTVRGSALQRLHTKFPGAPGGRVTHVYGQD